MKLSEAMRLGSMMIPAHYGPLFHRDYKNKKICGACAMGAALFAIGTNEDHTRWLRPKSSNLPFDDILKYWPWLKTQVACPADATILFVSTMSARSLIFYLFETKRWSRERIADWIATVEPKEDESYDPTEVSHEVTTSR